MNTPAPLRLGHELHAVLIDDDVVILDLPRNLYMCARAAMAARLQAQDTNADAVLIELLNSAGLSVIGCKDPPSPYRAPAKPSADIGVSDHARLTWQDVWDATIATLDFWRNYPGRSLSELFNRLDRADRPAGRIDEEAACALARRFQRWIVLAPVSGKCLVRSFMLLRYLQRSGQAADWVFGVRTWPFRAHCWVQIGQIALDEAQERLIAYTPLLAARAR